MTIKFGPYFPFRRDNRKSDGTWDAPDATDENIKGTSVDPYEPRWPRWKRKPPLHGEGDFISDQPFFDIDEISQRAVFYPPGRAVTDKNVGGNPASRQRVGDMPGGNFFRRRLLVGPADYSAEDTSSPSGAGSSAQADTQPWPIENAIQLAAAQTVPARGATRQRVYSSDEQMKNYFAAQGYLRDPKVQAFLDTIAWAEGGDYDVLFGGEGSTTTPVFQPPEVQRVAISFCLAPITR